MFKFMKGDSFLESQFAQPYILVDTSYVAYFNMFSTWNWYVEEFNVDNDPNFEPINSNEFRKAFEKKFKNSILSSVRRFYQSAKIDEKTVFAIDSPKKHIWRNALFSDYKLARKNADKSSQKFSYSGTFDYIQNHLVPNLCEETGAKCISVYSAEGDDIIAVLTKYLKDQLKVIVASDKDLIQLLKYKNTSIVNCTGKNITLESESTHKLLEGRTLSAKEFLLKKILTGDSSDGIPGIHPRCGEVSALKYILDTKLLVKKFKDLPDAKKQFDINDKIINFKHIPEEIEEQTIKLYEQKR